MSLDLCDYENKTKEAIKSFWKTRDDAKEKQKAAGKTDQGERAGVTGGKNMDGFANLVIDLVKANGLLRRQPQAGRGARGSPGGAADL